MLPDRDDDGWRVVNRTERTAFAWSLVDVAKVSLSHEVQLWLCVKIGAGEQEEAIYGLLQILADHAVAIPAMLLAPLRDWASGYLGSNNEPNLRALLTCLRVPELLHPTCTCAGCPMSAVHEPAYAVKRSRGDGPCRDVRG